MMLTRWNNVDRDWGGFAALDQLRQIARELDRGWAGFGLEPTSMLRGMTEASSFPRTNLSDSGEEFTLVAAIPGMSEKDIQVNVTGDTLTITGQRTLQMPEGYSVHRQERGDVRFSRSFTLPARIDSGKVAASVKDGLLKISLPKAQEAKPRQITVKASG